MMSKNLKKEFISRTGWFAFDYPADWETEEGESVAVFEPENGFGALTLSAYEAPSEIDAKKELIEHLSEEEQLESADDIVVEVQPEKTIASCETLADGDFLKVWFLVRSHHLVIATYNCEGDVNRKELSTVDEIVGSIRILSGTSRN